MRVVIFSFPNHVQKAIRSLFN